MEEMSDFAPVPSHFTRCAEHVDAISGALHDVHTQLELCVDSLSDGKGDEEAVGVSLAEGTDTHVGRSVKIWLAAKYLQHDEKAKRRILRKGSLITPDRTDIIHLLITQPSKIFQIQSACGTVYRPPPMPASSSSAPSKLFPIRRTLVRTRPTRGSRKGTLLDQDSVQNDPHLSQDLNRRQSIARTGGF